MSPALKAKLDAARDGVTLPDTRMVCTGCWVDVTCGDCPPRLFGVWVDAGHPSDECDAGDPWGCDNCYGYARVGYECPGCGSRFTVMLDDCYPIERAY